MSKRYKQYLLSFLVSTNQTPLKTSLYGKTPTLYTDETRTVSQKTKGYPCSIKIIISLDSSSLIFFGLGLSSFIIMHILRLYFATMWSLISIGSYIMVQWCLQDIALLNYGKWVQLSPFRVWTCTSPGCIH